jgi:DNA-binding transcriptional MerR regulator
MTDWLSLAELSEHSGVPPRTIRYYIAREILPGPNQAGRNARYGQDHLKRLQEVTSLKKKGLTLAEISVRLSEKRSGQALPSPSRWLQFEITDEVSVMVRSEVAPWRMRMIRRWLAESSRWLEEPTEKEG